MNLALRNRIKNRYLLKPNLPLNTLKDAALYQEFQDFFIAFLKGCPNERNIMLELYYQVGEPIPCPYGSNALQSPRTKHGKRWAKKPTYQKWLKACLINKMNGGK